MIPFSMRNASTVHLGFHSVLVMEFDVLGNSSEKGPLYQSKSRIKLVALLDSMPFLIRCPARFVSGVLFRLHSDTRGTVSIFTVLVMLAFTMLLGLLMNAGQQIDDKLRMQNAVDAATYSGGVSVARGMNAIAFTNHLLSEVFALTAYMREGRDRNAERMVPEVLDAWEQVGSIFSRSSFRKFSQMGSAIMAKVPMERTLVERFGELTAIKSQVTLPVLEYILGYPEAPPPNGQLDPLPQNQSPSATHLIPQFQRAVVRTIPMTAQLTMMEIARRHLPAQPNSGRLNPVLGILWRTRVAPVGSTDETDPYQRTLPGLDPAHEGPDASLILPNDLSAFQEIARRRRDELAYHYLDAWISDDNFDLGPFEREAFHEGGKVSAKMSQFINIWRVLTCGQLSYLLNVQFPNTNLPHVLRDLGDPDVELDYHLVGVCYWEPRRQMFPGLYRPSMSTSMTFSEVELFIPTPRYICCPWAIARPIFHEGVFLGWAYENFTDNWDREWSLFNQNWMVRLVPTRALNLPEILQTPPSMLDQSIQVRLPDLRGLDPLNLQWINYH